jgi:putative heme transporter
VLPDARRKAPHKFRISLRNLVIGVTSVGALAALVVAHHRIAGSLSEVAGAKPRALLGAVGLEWMSMLAFVRAQRRLLRAGNLRLTIESIIAITFAGNALSVSVPIAGPGLGAAFTYREFVRRDVSRAAAAFVPVVCGILSTVSFMVTVAVGALDSSETVAGTLGLLGAATIGVGITALLLAQRIPAFRRLIHRAAV